MCGISGILSLETNISPNQNDRVLKMLNTFYRRGPDQTKVISIGPITIGTCRLSIVDNELGIQPMISPCNNSAIVFNGEIYNFRQLKQSLYKHNFQSNSDTEVILHLFEDLGIKSLSNLNGMFAFCITNGKISYLVRDRLGVKPLYYKVEGPSLIFASEAKALVSSSPELKLESTYAHFETTIGCETLFKGIFELPPGSYLKFNSASGEYSIHKYYCLDYRLTESVSEKEAIEKMRWLVKDAIDLRINSTFPYGCFVSGGIDSTIVAYLAKPQYLFSAIVRDKEYFNEEQYVNILRKSIDAEFMSIELDPSQFPQYFVEMVYALDFPTTTLAAFVQFVLSRAAHEKQLRIMLGGLGADEYLGGYARHVALLCDNSELSKEQSYKNYGPLFSKLLQKSPEAPLSTLYFHLMNRSYNTSTDGLLLVEHLFKTQNSTLNALASIDFAISFPPLLRMDDRMNMYFSIESRAPFLDYRLIDYAYTLQDNFKIRKVEGGGIITKYILRKAFEDVIPKEISKRSDKIGFPSPVAIWLNTKFNNAVQNAYAIINNIPELAQLFSDQVINEKSEFSRKRWLVVQWAAWYLLFFQQVSIQETTKLLFLKRD